MTAALPLEASVDTRAILALCSRARGTAASARPLNAGEYHDLTLALRERGLRPGDLFAVTGDDLTAVIRSVPERARETVTMDRVRMLLERGGLIALRVADLAARGVWVLGRGDAGYPVRYRNRLAAAAPPLLYGCGPVELLDRGGLAVVGTRKPDSAAVADAEAAGALAADAGVPVISGAARGIDETAMLAALIRNGSAVGVLADSLLKASVRQPFRDRIMRGQLALVTAYEPDAPFSVGNAMGRNRYIYGLADTALVVAASEGTGGTWAGATEALKQSRIVYVLVGSPGRSGNDALVRLGARAVDTVSPHILRTEADTRSDVHADAVRHVPADALTLMTPLLLNAVQSARTPADVAQTLDLIPAQVKQWLMKLAERGLVRRESKTKYVLASAVNLPAPPPQLSLLPPVPSKRSESTQQRSHKGHA